MLGGVVVKGSVPYMLLYTFIPNFCKERYCYTVLAFAEFSYTKNEQEIHTSEARPAHLHLSGC